MAALLDDATYGLKPWHDVIHTAMVTDEKWMRAVAAMFAPLFPGLIRVFEHSELNDAKDWITAEKKNCDTIRR